MVEIRKGTIEDIDELVAMRMSYLNADYGQLEESEKNRIKDSLPSYFEKHINQDLFAYVAQDGQEIIATVLLYVMEKPANPLNLCGKIGEVLNVYTKSGYRRQGIAEKLVKIMLEDAAKKGLGTIKLDATDMGRPMYLKIGFRMEPNRYTPMRYEF